MAVPTSTSPPPVHASAAPAARRPAAYPLALAVVVAILAALLQLVVEQVRETSSHSPLGHHLHAPWMAPLGNLLVLGPLALLLMAAARLRARGLPRGVVEGTLATAGWIAVLLALPGFHRGALALLALGLGVQTGRFLSRREGSLNRGAWPAAAGGLALLLAYALAVSGWLRLREWRGLTALPPAPAGAPNVLLLVLDTVRNPSLSLFGYGKPTTPELERLAAEGACFERSYATAPWTLPSHAGMFTGRELHEMNAGFTAALDGHWPTLAERLATHGYATAGFAANRRYTSRVSGLARGFHHYSDVAASFGEIVASSTLARYFAYRPQVQRLLRYYNLPGRRSAGEINQAFLSWLDGRGDRPFFAFLNYYDAHNPYLAPPPFDRMFTADTAPYVPPTLHQGMSAAKIDREREAYEGAIAWLDHEIGALAAELRRRGVLDRTLLIITSDHGEQFGEHDFVDHGNTLYRVLLQVPLLIRLPGVVPAGVRVGAPATLRDLPRTVLDLTGLGGDTIFPGRSLARHWREPVAPPPEPILSALSWPDGKIGFSIFTESHHYIDWFQGREELYDLVADSMELVNRADSGVGHMRPYRALRDRLVGPIRRDPEHD